MKYWRVTSPGHTHVYVKADYVKQEDGSLVFREWVKNGYPDTVRVVAPGWWVTVRQITEHDYNTAHGEKPKPPIATTPRPVRTVTRKKRRGL